MSNLSSLIEIGETKINKNTIIKYVYFNTVSILKVEGKGFVRRNWFKVNKPLEKSTLYNGRPDEASDCVCANYLLST